MNSQEEYDIIEFCLENKENLQTYIKNQLEVLSRCSVLFSGHRDLYNEIENRHKISIVKEWLYQNYSSYHDIIKLTIDTDFVIILEKGFNNET